MKDNEYNLHLLNSLDYLRHRAVGVIYDRSDRAASAYQYMDLPLFCQAIWGNALRVIMKRHGEENLDFPERGFNDQFLAWISRANHKTPCAAWCFIVFSVHHGHAILERFDLPQAQTAIEEYRIATSPELWTGLEEMASAYTLTEPFGIPEENEAWSQIEALDGAFPYGMKARRAPSVDPLPREFADAEDSLFGIVRHLIRDSASSYGRFLDMAFTGKFETYLRVAIKNDLTDMARRQTPPDRYYLLSVEALAEEDTEIEDDRAYDRTLGAPHPQPLPPLSALDLELDTLTPAERRALGDVYQGLQQGYYFNAKRHLSFQKLWGKHYGKKMKAFHRARNRLRGFES